MTEFKLTYFIAFFVLSFVNETSYSLISYAQSNSVGGKKKINVVATISSYGNIAKIIGADRVVVTSFCYGNEDPHFVRPKLSFSEKLASADIFIDTGLDLELWVPALQDTAGNKKIMSGADGYVAAANGINLLEKVPVMDRKEGDVHVYGNPHVYNCPVCLVQVARNIYTGLAKVDPLNKTYYQKNLEDFEQKLHEKLYGQPLVKILGGKTLDKLAMKGKLIDFLKNQTYEGKPLIEKLGGWLKDAMPIRGKKVVAYHKNWAYFEKIFGIEVVDYIEPKPGIPPTPKHVQRIISLMKSENIKVILAAKYYDRNKVENIARKVGAKAVIVSIAVDKEATDVFEVTQKILQQLRQAFGIK